MPPLPGIYVPIKGDYGHLEKSLKEAKAIVTNQATGISNALNNALSPTAVRNNIDSLVRQFTTLDRAANMSSKVFSQIGVDLGELRKITGLADEQLASFQARMLQTKTINSQENTFKKIASAIGLTRGEILDLGRQFKLSEDSINKVAISLHGAEVRARSLAEQMANIPAIKSYTTLASASSSALERRMGGNVDSFASGLVTIADAQSASKSAFNLIGIDADQLAAKVGITAEQFSILKGKIADVSAEKAQSDAFRSIAQSAGMSRDEIADFGRSFGLNAKQIEQVQVALHGAAQEAKTFAQIVSSLPKINTLATISQGAQAGMFGAMGSEAERFAANLTQLSQSGRAVDVVFGGLDGQLEELRQHVKITDDQFASLQNKLKQVSGSNLQISALKSLARQLDLTEDEARALGAQFGLTSSQMEKIVGPARSAGKAVSEIGDVGKKRMDLFGGSVAMAAGKFLLLEQAAYSVQRILNAVVFDFNATVETATMGIAAAFLNNGEYTNQITGKVLRGQEAMSAAMDDADSVIQKLRASNLQTIATLDQLIKAYQEAAPVALSKGFNKDQVEQFTVAMMQAAGAVDTTGMLIGQMGEEMRSILTGGINPKNTRIATALGITNQDIARYQGDIQGLFDFLMSKLDAYKAFGEQLQKTWSGVASNTIDVLQQVSAQATEPLFEAIRDGLYDWQQGIARINKETGLLEWNPEYQQGIERVKDTIESLVNLVSSNKDTVGAMFDAAGWAALQSLDGINQVLTLLGNVVTTAKTAIQEIKGLTGISVDIPKPWDIPGAMINGAKQLNLKWSELNDEWSGKRNSQGDLTNATAEELAVDRLKQKIKGLKQELSVKENSITGLIFGNRAPEAIQNDIKATESQLKDLEGRLKGAASKATWSPSIKITADEQEILDKKIDEMQKAADKANKAAEEYVRTAKESAIAKFDEMTKYLAPGSDLMLKAQAKLNEELAEIDEREAKSGRTAAMRGEREELKQLNATIKGYVADARNAAEISDEWNKSAQETIEAMARLNDEITMSGLGEFGRAAYDMGRQLQEGGDEIDKFNARLAEAKEQAENTKAWYEAVGAQLGEAKGKLGVNSAGSSVEEANKVRELADQHQRLGESLKEQTVIYQKLLELEANGRITSRDQLEQELAAQRKYDALISAYHEIGRVSEETFSLITAHEDAEKFNFIQATGDKELAYRLFSERMLEYRRAFAADQYEKTGSVGALMDAGLSSYQSNLREDAVKFYEDVLPNAIDQSSDALGEFARNAAESNMSLSEAWENLGKTISDVVFDILQDLTALSVKMAIMGTLGASGGEGSMATGIGSLLGSLFTANAQGNVYASPGLSAYSNTVISSPTIFPFAKGIGLMGEAGSEAIMPLTRMPGGDLGVKAQSSSPNINVTVNNNSSAQASARVEQSQDGMSWDVIVDMVEQKMQSRINQGRQGVGKRGPMI